MPAWIKGKLPGVQYYEHETRKKTVSQRDRYYRCRFKVAGKAYYSMFGWSTEGWTEKKVFLKLQEYKANAKRGVKPVCLKDEREAAEAERAANERRKEEQARADTTFSDFFTDTYYPAATRNKKTKTYNTEDGHFRHWLKPVLGRLKIRDIRPLHLESVRKKMMEAGKSPRTVQYVFATFRQVWNAARMYDIVSGDSPTRKVKLSRFNNRRIRFLSRHEATRLLDELKRRSEHLHDIALLSLHTGMRASEIFSLTWSDVDLDNELLSILDAKGGSRYVHLTSATLKMLTGMQGDDQKPNDLVFLNRKGEKIDEVSNAFTKAVDVLGLNEGVSDRRQRVMFHTLRHTFASWHVQNGTDLYTVKELIGHQSIQLTERYSHLAPSGLKKAVANFEKQSQASGNVIDITEKIGNAEVE